LKPRHRAQHLFIASALLVPLFSPRQAPASSPPLFSDGFESGDLSNWTRAVGMVVQQQEVFSGSWAVRATSTGGRAFAEESLSPQLSDLYFRLWVKVIGRSGKVTLVKLLTGSSSSILWLGISKAGMLQTLNSTTGVLTTSSTQVPNGTWHEVLLHALVGTSGHVDVWFDGVKVAALSKAVSLGTTPIGRVNIGDSALNRMYDVAFDDVVAFIDTSAPAQPTGLHAVDVRFNRVTLAWNPSTDDVGVAGYTIYRDGASIGTVDGATTAYGDTSVSPVSTYTYAVDAFDVANNFSLPSDALQVNTPVPNPLIAAAGNIACDPNNPNFKGGLGTATACRMKDTSDLLLSLNPMAVLALGDDQYRCGGYQAFLQSYDPSWGRIKSITYPTTGDKEWKSTANSTGTDCSTKHDAAGYFKYFDSIAGDPTKTYYSFDTGTWHVVSLTGNCPKVGGCGLGSPQEMWLKADLAAHPTTCTLAFWHEPRFSSGVHGSLPAYDQFWRDLYAASVEIVLNAHEHDYERFAPQDPDQNPDPNGIREFVVGTGGAGHVAFPGPVVANSEVRNANTWGVLELTLYPSSYDWSFIPTAGGTFTDSGSGTCH